MVQTDHQVIHLQRALQLFEDFGETTIKIICLCHSCVSALL